jgi:protein TonB
VNTSWRWRNACASQFHARYIGRPQALLRSVVVVKYSVDANGSLMRSEIMRSNRDRATESNRIDDIAQVRRLFPSRPHRCCVKDVIELIETWLFNNDGRFQLRTIAEPQMNE